MRMVLRLICSTAFPLLIVSALAQTPGGDTKHFAKDGLSFDYANGWAINDESNSDAQQLTLNRPDSDAVIKLFVHRGKTDTEEKMAAARTKLIDPYIEATANQFVRMGAKPERTAASAQIGGAPAEGVRLRAALGGEPGEAAIYWLTIDGRVVVITLFGPDQAIKRATATWDTVRNSLRVERIKPTPKPTPKQR